MTDLMQAPTPIFERVAEEFRSAGRAIPGEQWPELSLQVQGQLSLPTWAAPDRPARRGLRAVPDATPEPGPGADAGEETAGPAQPDPA